MEIIFIAGIHGVGKTYYCNSLNNGIKNYSASDLIREYKEINDKIVKNVGENQNYLLEDISNLNEEKIYLDGHFCLINSKNEIEEIPLDIFKALNIKKIILLYSNPVLIAQRLEKRDHKKYSIEMLEKFQEKELNYGEEIANILNVPFEKIKV